MLIVNNSVDKVISRIGITPVGSAKYRVNRLRFHLLSYAIAKAQLVGQDAQFIIRCDDTDVNRTNRSFLDAYLEVLYSLNITPNIIPYDKDSNGFTLFQSERKELYQIFVEHLLKSELAFRDLSGAIFLNPETFLKRFQNLLVGNKLSVYDISMGNRFVDIRSPLKERKGQVGFVPFPLVRSNGQYLFNLCSPVDDAMLGVTHVVRDRDKLDLLAKQEMVRISLGFPPIKYVHAPLLISKDGKRFIHDEYYGDATFQNFVAKGILPEALVSYLLSGFFGPSERYYTSLDDFSSQVNFSHLHQSHTVFTASVLKQHNKKALELSSAQNYEADLKRFLACCNPSMLYLINTDQYLLKMVVRLKRCLSEVCSIIEGLSQPQYEIPALDHARALNLVLDFFLREKFLDEVKIDSYMDTILANGENHMKSLGISKSEYYQALRYLFTGKFQGCDLHDVLWYLVRSGSITKRLRMAKEELLKLNLLDNNRELQIGG